MNKRLLSCQAAVGGRGTAVPGATGVAAAAAAAACLGGVVPQEGGSRPETAGNSLISG